MQTSIRSFHLAVLAAFFVSTTLVSAQEPERVRASESSDAAARSSDSTAADANTSNRNRGVRLGDVIFSGQVRDAQTGAPVFGAIVTVQSKSTEASSSGMFRFTGLSKGTATVSIERWGYVSTTRQVTLDTGQNGLEITLTPKPIINLVDTSDVLHPLDAESASFSQILALTGAQPIAEVQFCKADGTQFRAGKATIAKLEGPGKKGRRETCCPVDVTLVGIELKTGERIDAGIRDCVHYKVIFSGRNRANGEGEVFEMDQIKSIQFP